MAENGEVAVARPDFKPNIGSSFLGGSSIKYFEKKIEFVPARKPFNGLTCSNQDFKIETLNPGGPDPSSGQGSGQAAVNVKAKKGDVSESFDGSLDPELRLGVSFQRIGAGLENLGNTCFLNSVLQCLTYTEPLAAYLQSGKHQSSCRINGFCALCAIQKHVSRTLKATGRSLAPKDLVANLRCISRNFRNARQEDAHEYMVNLLESMHKCCLPLGVPSESPGAYEKSLVHKIFGGRLRSQVKCLQCNHCSNKFDPFLDLSLEIAKADSIQKAIRYFTMPEQLDGGERQYQCQKCKQKVRALKQLTIDKAPYVLTVHLKRFHSHDIGQKINKNVNFDTTLDLEPFVSSPYKGDLKYSLYGVLVHHGWSTHSGHYYCYVRTSTNMWYSLDDNQVRQVNESTVLQQKAYMLFYVRSRNSTPRKLVEIAQRQNLRENINSNNRAATSAFNQSSACAVQMGPLTDKCSVAVSSSSSVSRKEAERVNFVKEFEIFESVQKDSRNLVTAPNANPEIKMDKSDPSADSVTVQKDSGNLVIAPNANPEIKIVKSDPSADSVTVRKVPRNLVAAHNANPEIEIVRSDPCADPVKKLTISCGLGEVSAVKVTGNEGDGKVLSGNSSNKIKLENSGNNRSPKSSQEVVASTPLDKRTAVSMQDEAHTSTGSPTVSTVFLQAEEINSKTQKKLKKKHTKYQLTSVPFGANILMRASLGMRKKRMKKKHGAVKKDRASYDMGPSTSETRVSVASLERSRVKLRKRKRADKRAKREETNSNGGSVVNAANAETKVIEDVKDCKNDTMENGLMSMLTRGLEETLVAHWEGIDLSPSPTMESPSARNGNRVNSIGYVLDDWDEEYDRGKRKKVRYSQHDFGGPNYFQEIASRKIKSKKARFDRAFAGNRPLRI